MTQRVENGLTYTQTFDAENRLITVTVSGQTTQFVYDGNGNLVKKIKPDGSKTIYVGGIYEVDKNSGGTVTGTKTYYPLAGAMRINSTLYYVLKDHLGSASVVTDSSGNVVGDQRYYPFGETRLATGSMFTDKLYTSQREMTGLGIYHYGARFYSPKLGRFLSADSIVPNPFNPQDFNRFAYVRNNPVRYVDPSGHEPKYGCYTSVNGVCTNANGSALPADNDRVAASAYQFKSKSKPKGGGGGGGGGDLPAPASGSGSDDDTGPITDAILNLPGSAEIYDGAAIAFDTIAWFTDLFAAGVVTYGGIYGTGLAIPFTVVGGPAVPTVTGLAGMVIAEFYVQPILTVGNVFASLSTVSTVIADTKTGNTRIEDGVFSSNVQNSFTLTATGWVNKEAYLSLAIQTVALTNDFGWTSLPFQTNP